MRQPRLPSERPGDRERDTLEQSLKGSRGRVPTPFKVWMQSPVLAKLLQPLGNFLANDTSLSKAEAEIAILFIARRWHANYVLEVHSEEAAKAGLPETAIAALKDGRLPDMDDRRARSICDVLAALDADARPDDAVFAAAVECLGHAGLAELLSLTGYFTSVSLAMKLYDVRPRGN